MNNRVVVVTLNYNQNDYTVDCVKSLLSSVYDNLLVVVVDNGSTESNYIDLARRLGSSNKLKVERIENNIGYVGGINVAMEFAASNGADFILIMNNDTLIAQDAIYSLVEACERYGSKCITSGKVYNYDDKDTLQYIGQDFDPKGMLDQRSIVKNRRERDLGQYDQEREMGMLDDIFWLVPITLYKKLGSYSEYFFLYGEQNDYAFRALREGYKLIYTPKAKLWHKGGATTCGGVKKSAKIEYWTSFATLKLAVLHFPPKQANAFIRRWVTRRFVKNLLLYVSGKTKLSNLWATLMAYRHFKHWNQVRYVDNGYNPFS